MYNLVKSLEEEFIANYFAEYFENQKLNLYNLLPEPIIKQKVEQEAQHKWLALEESIGQGLRCFLEQVDKRLGVDEKEKVEAEFYQLVESMQKESFDRQSLMISTNLLRHLYELAKVCLKEKKFPEAFLLFQLLTLLMPQMVEAWLGLGMVYQEQLLFHEAVQAYEKALEIQNDHPLPLIYAAECQGHLRDVNQAQVLIGKALDLIQAREEFKCYQQEAQRVLFGIQKI